MILYKLNVITRSALYILKNKIKIEKSYKITLRLLDISQKIKEYLDEFALNLE